MLGQRPAVKSLRDKSFRLSTSVPNVLCPPWSISFCLEKNPTFYAGHQKAQPLSVLNVCTNSNMLKFPCVLLPQKATEEARGGAVRLPLSVARHGMRAADWRIGLVWRRPSPAIGLCSTDPRGCRHYPPIPTRG